MITGDTKVHSLFGCPVAHSLSPVIFNATFDKLGMNRTYVPFEVDEAGLKKAVEAARTLGFQGFNVTMPHKTAILQMLDRLDKTAEKASAVNTVSVANGELVGHNTDGEGAELAIKAYDISPKEKRVLVIGAGGAARAIIQRLTTDRVPVRILNRTLHNARKAADTASGPGKTEFDTLTKSTLEVSLQETDIIINATPIQTTTIVEQLGTNVSSLERVDWIFDLAYDKPPTQIAKIGRISPLEMLLQQAALSYQIWFRQIAPISIMRSALVDHLGEDWR